MADSNDYLLSLAHLWAVGSGLISAGQAPLMLQAMSMAGLGSSVSSGLRVALVCLYCDGG